MKTAIRTQTISNQGCAGSMVQICQRCANQFALVWIAEGDDFNDFGDRFCPFCGLHTDDVTGSILELYPETDECAVWQK